LIRVVFTKSPLKSLPFGFIGLSGKCGKAMLEPEVDDFGRFGFLDVGFSTAVKPRRVYYFRGFAGGYAQAS
jgi:hypothetical protein